MNRPRAATVIRKYARFSVCCWAITGRPCILCRGLSAVCTSIEPTRDANGQAPFVVVDPAKQREALTMLEEQVFSDKPFQFPPELYNKLTASRWYHWGSDLPMRTDYAVHEVIGMWQARILSQLLSPLTLERLHDSELKVPADQDAFTTA